MNWVWTLEDLGPTETLLMMALADAADDDGFCWPSQVVLARKSRQTDRNVRRLITRLSRQGLLRVEHRSSTGGRRSNRYWLNVGYRPEPLGSRQPDNLSGSGRAVGDSPGERSSDVPVSVGIPANGHPVRSRNRTDCPVAQPDTGVRSLPDTGVRLHIGTPSRNHQTPPDQTQEVTSAREASDSSGVGSGGVGGAPQGAPPPPSALSSSPARRPGGPVVGTAAGAGAPPGASGSSPAPGGGPVAGDGSQRPCEAPGAAAGGPGAPQGGPGAGRRSEGLPAPLGVVSAPVVAGGGLAGLLGACLPPTLRVMDAAGARRVGALLAERLEAGWRPEEIRSLVDGPLPAPVRRMSALVASRLEANVDLGLAPGAVAAAAGRGRAAVERDRSEEVRARCEALAAPSAAAPARRGRDRAWGAALARARAADPSAGLVEVAAAAAALLARQGPAGAVGAPGAT